jgi:hypothetical protein
MQSFWVLIHAWRNKIFHFRLTIKCLREIGTSRKRVKGEREGGIGESLKLYWN